MLTDLCRSQLNDRNNAFNFHSQATGYVDCNVAMTSQCIELALGKQWTAQDVRTLGGDTKGPTGNTMTRRVYRKAGLDLSRYAMLRNAPIQTVRDLLKADWFVVLYVDYGILQDITTFPTGSPTYRGFHAIGVSDWWRSKGIKVHYHDPINDGRTRGNFTAPKGVQTVAFKDIRDAAYGFTGDVGVVSGHAVLPDA